MAKHKNKYKATERAWAKGPRLSPNRYSAPSKYALKVLRGGAVSTQAPAVRCGTARPRLVLDDAPFPPALAVMVPPPAPEVDGIALRASMRRWVKRLGTGGYDRSRGRQLIHAIDRLKAKRHPAPAPMAATHGWGDGSGYVPGRGLSLG